MHNSTMSGTVLVVEDNEPLNRLIQKQLQRSGFKTDFAYTGAEALQKILRSPPAIMILDLKMPDMSATKLIGVIKEKKINVEFIVITGLGDERVAVEMMRLGAHDFLIKEGDFHLNLPRAVHLLFVEILHRKASEVAQHGLRRASRLWQTTFDSINDPVWIIDNDNIVQQCNAATEKYFNLSSSAIVGKNCCDLVHSFSGTTGPCPFVRMNASRHRETEVVTVNEKHLQVTVDPIFDPNGNISGAVHIISDITDRKQAEEDKIKLLDQLQQAQKLKAIGQLSSGVAHDFNNLLGGIMGHAELLKMNLAKEPELLRHAENIIGSCTKAADLTRQLLTFARKAPFEMQKVEPNTIVKAVMEIMQRTVDRRIEIVLNLQKKPGFVRGDVNQFENALLNIVINARDAMPDGGRLSITTETVTLDPNTVFDVHFAIIEGQFVRISVEDTGTGMSEQTKRHIFEPFFTTKEIGKGTGLGLASMYGCIKQHNGYVKVESQEGKGTKVDIYLPLFLSNESVAQVKTETALVSGTGTLLVVDDETVYHEILTEIFGDLGYTVHCCSDGIEAVAFYREHWKTIDVVILDMNMPKMNGLDCFRGLKEINSKVKVVVSSGYGKNNDLYTVQREGGCEYIQKPYQISDLAKKIADLTGK